MASSSDNVQPEPTNCVPETVVLYTIFTLTSDATSTESTVLSAMLEIVSIYSTPPCL